LRRVDQGGEDFSQSPLSRRESGPGGEDWCLWGVSTHASALLTISGGISLGSYKAGVNWGLLELFKLTAHDSLRRAWNLPR